MADGSGYPITASTNFGTDNAGVGGASPDALGLGSAQLQAVAALATPANFDYGASQPAVSAHSTFSSPTMQSAFSSPTIQSGPTKLFVGSIPPGTTQEMIKGEFGKIGDIAEIFLKSDHADPSRLWGFVTFVSPQAAATAVANFNERLVFPNAQRPLAVSFARSSSGGGGGGMDAGGGSGMANSMVVQSAAGGIGPTKLFVGSIPAGTTREQINAEFGRFGQVMDIFLKNDNAEPGRMWGFVTYNNSSSAAAAVTNFHERLVLPGGSRPCAVSFARNSQAQHSIAAQNLSTGLVNPAVGGTKLFIGTIPKGTTEAALRVEFERFGQVTEVFLKDDGTDPQRMWGFLSYADPQSAAVAVTTLHEKLMMPGSVRPLAVSFAKNSGRGPPGQQPATQSMLAIGGLPPSGGADTGPWKVYYTAQGLPYYHNTLTNTTQWDCPPEYPGGPVPPLPDTSNSSSAVGGVQQAQQMAGTTLGIGQGSLNVQASADPALGYAAVSNAGDTQRYSPF